jgi:hypothetical protein
VVVRSLAAGSRRLEICTGIASRIRFSSRPDRTGICEMTFPVGFRQFAPGWAVPKVAERNEYFGDGTALKGTAPSEIENSPPPGERASIVCVCVRTWLGRLSPSILRSMRGRSDRIVRLLN